MGIRTVDTCRGIVIDHDIVVSDLGLGSNFIQSTKDAVLGLLFGGLGKGLEKFLIVGF